MIRKRQTHQPLHQPFTQCREPPKPFRHTRALEMPSRERADEICGAEDVEPAGEDAGGDPVQPGAVPRYLRLVDREMWGDGALQTLGGEDRVGVGGGGGCGFGTGAGGGGCVCCGAGRGLVGRNAKREWRRKALD